MNAMNLQEMLPQVGRMFADTTHRLSPPSTGTIPQQRPDAPPITDPVELFCLDFNAQCRWRNIEGLLVDEMDWFQGEGFLDEARLRLATGTPVRPDGFYAIAATDRVEFPTAKAILVSDVIECQLGAAELRFTFVLSYEKASKGVDWRYWTSPQVRIVVCTKAVASLFPNYDYCGHPIEDGDPGPAYVSIPDPSGQPFQIFIRAENFVFQTPKLNGGFAIIDSLEYYGDFCPPGRQPPMQRPQLPLTTNIKQADSPQFSFLTNDHVEAGGVPFGSQIPLNNSLPLAFASKTLGTSGAEIKLRPQNPRKETCEVVNCSFNATEACVHHLDESQWLRTSRPIADILGGIPGDASGVPWRSDGNFAYILGPQIRSRFKTRPFVLDEPLFFMFAYHKSIQLGDLKVFIKRREAQQEELIFEAPKLALESHRWFREVRPLEAGEYSYIAFEVTNLPMALSIGVDEFALLDRHKQHYCP
ncbi:MAM domain-containing protein [Aphelenchoides fujianensis]|nr:MAM domain-containing protein [Aphelenchoides fujianensis]